MRIILTFIAPGHTKNTRIDESVDKRFVFVRVIWNEDMRVDESEELQRREAFQLLNFSAIISKLVKI